MTGQPAKRLDYIDNLRWVMIVFVVGVHAAVTYSHLGSWYYNSEAIPDTASFLVFLAFQASLQAFFMGFMFFLAGYFVPTAYDRKGFGRFLADRAIRLGVPTLLYVFVIHIGMGLFLLDWYGQTPLLAAYIDYIVKLRWLDGTGPMWFAAALLFFSVVYAVFRLVFRRVPAAVQKPVAPAFAAILAVGVAMGAVTFLVRQVAPLGSNWHNMQLCYFTQYVVLFALGIVARRKGWLEALPARWGKPVLWAAVIAAPLSVVGIVMLSMAAHGAKNAFDGGWTWQAASLAFWEQIFCVLFCTGLLIVFREAFNRRGRLIGFLSDNGFAVYVIHPPVLVAISLAMRPLGWPPLAMFAVAWIAAVAGSFVLAAGLRQVPVLRKVL